MGQRKAVYPVIVIADAGPLLHLFWVDAHLWALPPQEIAVVKAVWEEVDAYAPDTLADSRFQRTKAPLPLSPLLADKRLHTGEAASLSYALTQLGENLLILSDDQRARQACRTLGLPYIGSIGLIVEACRTGLTSREAAEAALRGLPERGRLYVKPNVINAALASLEPGAKGKP